VIARAARRTLVGAVVCAAVGGVAACTPPVPDDQTTSVDVTRYQDLAADPWLAATSLTVGRYAFGTNRQFEPGTGRSQRTVTGTVVQVLTTETAAAAGTGWVVAAARCGDAEGTPGDDDGWPVTVELVRELSDGSVAVGEVVLGRERSVLDEDGTREVPRRVELAAFAPHHTYDTSVDVPDEPVDYDALTCLGGTGGASVGPTDLLATVHGGAAAAPVDDGGNE
jgi:hypothetical protein